MKLQFVLAIIVLVFYMCSTHVNAAHILQSRVNAPVDGQERAAQLVLHPVENLPLKPQQAGQERALQNGPINSAKEPCWICCDGSCG